MKSKLPAINDPEPRSLAWWIKHTPKEDISRPFVIGMYKGKTPSECEAMVGTNPFNQESPNSIR